MKIIYVVRKNFLLKYFRKRYKKPIFSKWLVPGHFYGEKIIV